MSVAERVLGTWRVQSLPAMEEWTALNETVEENWGWFPALTLVNALGLLLVAFANSGAVAGAWGVELLFWLGLLVMLVPSAMRLVTPLIARRERIAIVVGLSIAFYLVKILQSPFAFTYGDEFFHLFNTNQILQNGTLFTENPALQVSPMFPGLVSVTAALSTITGLSVFATGLIVVGVARLVLFLAFYFFAEQVSWSPRVAGLATLFYMGQGTFLYWSAQFAYESLALPLAIGVFYMIARREGTAERSHYIGLSVLALLGISAVVITHHLTSYVVAVSLLVWTLFAQARVPYWINKWYNALFLSNEGKLFNNQLSNLSIWSQPDQGEAEAAPPGEKPAEGPQGLAVFALIAALAWLIYVALLTVNYLSPVISKGILAVLNLVLGEGQGRPLFVSHTGYVAPLWERVVGIGAVVLSLAALPFGLAQIWERARTNTPALLLGVAGIGYFAVLGLRLTTASWQLGNRASTYLFIGLAFVLAMAVERLWAGRWESWRSRGLFAAALSVIFLGGVIAGWEPQLRLAQPYVVATGQTTVEAQGLAVAEWMRNTLGPGHKVAADEANGRYILAYGEQHPYVGRFPFVRDILTEPVLSLTQRAVMAEWALDYVVVDRRLSAWDIMTGYFFNRKSSQPEAGWFAPAVYQKYDQQEKVNRVMDSGDVVIYEVGALYNEYLAK